MKSRFLPILLAIAAVLLATLACAAGGGGELGLSNARMAFDPDGNQPTNTFSTTDTFYVVADLNNAPAGTVVTSKWYAVNVEGYEPNYLFHELPLNIEEDFDGSIYFELTNDGEWPTGEYKVELYLN